MDAGRAVATAGRALPAAERLVVRPGGRPDHDVVHRPLALRRDVGRLGEREQDGVGDPLARLDVAGDDRGGPLRVHEAAFRRADRDRCVQAGVDGHIGAECNLDRKRAGRAGHRERRVDVPRSRRRCPGEVDVDRVAGDGDGDADREVVVGDTVALDLAVGLVAAVREAADRLAGAALGIGDHLVERDEDGVAATALDQLGEPPAGDPVGSDLRLQVGPAGLGRAHVGEDQAQHLVPQPDGRDDQALLPDRRRPGRHRARHESADVRMVRAGAGVADDLFADRKRRDERDVRQVRPTRERVVEDEDVARLRVARDHGGDRFRHRTEVDGDVLRLGDHAAAGVEERGRAVAPLLDVGGEALRTSTVPISSAMPERAALITDRVTGSTFAPGRGCRPRRARPPSPDGRNRWLPEARRSRAP